MSGSYTNLQKSQQSSYERNEFHSEASYSYSSSTPPAPPMHTDSGTTKLEFSSSQHTLHDIPVHSNTPPPNYPYTQSNTTLVRDSMSDMKFTSHYDSDDDMEKMIPPPPGGVATAAANQGPYNQQRPYVVRKKRSCIDKMCCGCCTCCPKWLRWCTCIIFIIILIIVIIVGVLAALFKVPEISFTDPAAPVVTHPSSSSINITSSIDISVQNPNVEGITFSSIKADAYYPPPYNVYLGGGQVNDIHISSKATTNFTFPFSIMVDSQQSVEQGAIMDLVTRCGLDGSAPQNIDLSLKIYPTVNFGVIPITPTITKTVSFPCPLTREDLTYIFASGGIL